VIPLVAAIASSAWFCAVIAHNTMHCPVFRGARANGLFHIVLTCAYGFPVSEYLPGHTLSHHLHVQKKGDLIRTSKSPFVRVNALNLLYFCPRVAIDVLIHNYCYASLMKKQRPDWYRQLLREAVCCWTIKAALLASDWRRALLFVIVPHIWALYGITTVNFFQHDGCDEEDPYNHSRNFVGRIFNWFTFNSGFHGVHHVMPGLHWSQLRKVHEKRFHGRVAPELEQPSLALYVLRTFFLPGKRERYDGSTIEPIEHPEVT
jgi:fatty acid desaturase